MSNIKYAIFSLRKKFDILKWLKQNPKSTYEDFTSFLSSKNVIAPDREYFNKALGLFNSMKERQASFKENKQVKVVKKETADKKEIKAAQKEESLLEDSEKEVQEPVKQEQTKPKSRRRRRKKPEDES